MPKALNQAAIAQYARDGYYFPHRVMSADDAERYHRHLLAYENATGGAIASNCRHKVHLLFTWANELVRHPAILDAVEDMIGSNIICWTTNFFIKEANSPAFVSWHQDSTYWGLSTDDVITAWLALTDAPVASGAMKFWPGSHKQPQYEHRDTFHQDNLLSRGQEVAVDVPENEGVLIPLAAGEISLHNVKLVHGSAPNETANRRVGLAIRYVPPHVRQIKVRDSAMLVRGVDTHGHFDPEPDPHADVDAAARAAHGDAMQRQVAALYSGTDKTEFRA